MFEHAKVLYQRLSHCMLCHRMADAERLVSVHTLFQSIRLRGRQVEEVVPYAPSEHRRWW